MKHSIYAPSSIADKILCPGRHLATLDAEDSSGDAAERGTECHDFAEPLLHAVIKKEDIPFPVLPEEWQIDCTKQMVQHAYQQYNDLEMFGDTRIWTEKQVDLSWYEPSLDFDMGQVFGTCDVLLYSAALKTLIVLDYKTGVGIEVDPIRNEQLMTYALGALGFIEGEVEKIKIVVSQPRIHEAAQVWETTPDELYVWADETLIPALVQMSAPGAPFHPGKKQCQWCPIKGRCDAQKGEMLAMFDDKPSAPTITEEQLAELLERLPVFKQWLKQIESAAMDTLKAGRPLNGFKLVRGTSHRKWTDVGAADKWLKGQKLNQDERYTKKLIGPAVAENLLAKKMKRVKLTRNRFAELVVKPEGNLSYAKADDPRKAVITDPVAQLLTLEDLL